MIDKIFDKVYLVNLPQFKENLELSKQEFKKISLENWELIPGIIINGGSTHKDRENGCKAAHLNIIRDAKEKNYKNILIFEDDIEFDKNFNNYIDKIKDFIEKEEWNLFYLGGNIKDYAESYKLGFKRVNWMQTTHAYAINSCAYDLILNSKDIDKPIDLIYVTEINSLRKSYVTNPRLAFQRPGLSYIVGQFRNYTELRDKKERRY